MYEKDLTSLHIGAWLLLLLGLALHAEAASDPVTDSFMQLVGWTMLAAGVVAVLAVVGWELVRMAVRSQ